MKNLLSNEKLDWSDTVANSSMNRKRKAIGVNSYEKAIDLNVVNYLEQLFKQQPKIAWLDVCCGEGNALIETASFLNKKYGADNIRLDGVDLVNYYQVFPSTLSNIRFHTGPIRNWKATVSYDLITCVHGLHYIGDKLQVISQLLSYLKEDGLFVGNFDLASIVDEENKSLKKLVGAYWKKNGLGYLNRKKLLWHKGKVTLKPLLRYLGADDRAGPNYTGQRAVLSCYSRDFGS